MKFGRPLIAATHLLLLGLLLLGSPRLAIAQASGGPPTAGHAFHDGKLMAGTAGALPALPQDTGNSAGRAQQQGGAAVPLTNATEMAIDQESRGEFPTMERSPNMPLGTLQRSWDRPLPANGQSAPGVIHYLWQADFVMGVRTRDFMVTTLMLPNWEKVSDLYVGDSLVFEAKKVRSNVIAVRSRNAGADSNLTVLGASGNLYNFYLRSEAWNTRQITDLAVYVDATRPEEESDTAATDMMIESKGGSGIVAPDYIRRIARRPEDIRFDMQILARSARDAEIAPERVFEDGLFTYFDFGSRADSMARPVVHQIVDGVDTVVNSRTVGPQGSILVAEAVGDFTLRNGAKVVCVKRKPSHGSEGGDER